MTIKRRCFRITVYVLIMMAGFFLQAPWGAADSGEGEILFIPVRGQIEPGLADFVERSLDKASRTGVKKVVLDIDTPGGLIDSAKKIKNSVFRAGLPTVAFINGEAKSAGVLISLAAEEIYMTPGASIGAAEPIPSTEKILASWRSDLESAAEARGRDPLIVAGMADKNIEIENIKNRGEILSLSAEKAVELGIADGITKNRSALLKLLTEKDGVYYNTVEATPGWGEKMAWWIINPYVSPILLLLGFAGLIIEGFVPGFGVPGTIGLVSLSLFFAGHMMAGVTGWLAVFIFGLGLVALLLEIFVIPGFGAAGLIGVGLIIGSVFMASTGPAQAVISLGVALAGSVILVYVLVKVFGRRGMWDKLILGIRMDTATGYTAPKKGLEKYLGLEGVAITPLRPAGTAELGGDRVDVVTEGGFVAPGAPVKVVLVEGGRVVVRSSK